MSNSIQNILTQISEDTTDDDALNQIKHKLESDFQLNINVKSLEEIKQNFVYIQDLLKEKTNDFKQNSETFSKVYKTINKIRILLSEVLNNKNPLFTEILRRENHYKWKYYFYEGAYLIEDANKKFTNNETNEVTDIEKFLNNHLEAVKIFLKSIEECSPYLEQKELNYFEQPILILLQWLEEEEKEIEKQHKPLIKQILVITKAILWEMNKIKGNKVAEFQPTVANLQKYLDSSSGWQGDDFEECLEFVNNMRRN